MVSVKKEENLGFSFGEEESILPEERHGLASVKPELFIKDQSLKREYEEKFIPIKKVRPSTYSRFAGEFKCDACVEDHNPSCKYHNCRICTQRVGSHNALVCKICEYTTHIACMKLPLVNLCPKSWVCSHCSINSSGSFETLKAKYIGKVPGIKVGSSWSHRIQMTENRLHAPSMAGIHGNSEGLAYSLVTQGGYVKDDDYGFEFFYTGAGGRDIKEAHVKDQALLTTNRGLAGTCDAELSEYGATAYDWRKSAPIRVIRGYKLKKHAPSIAPAEGFRYDGIYKLFRYWKEEADSTGFRIWRFHFIRDDDEPEPWTDLGKEYILLNNLKIDRTTIVRNYKKNDKKNSEFALSPRVKNEASLNSLSNHYNSESFKVIGSDLRDANMVIKLSPPDFSGSRTDITTELPSVCETSEIDVLPVGNLFQLFPAIKDLIFSDKNNSAFWLNASQKHYISELEFLYETQEYFNCNICFEMVDFNVPTTTACGHNFCLPCFRAAILKTEGRCPSCHQPLEQLIAQQSTINSSSTPTNMSNPSLSTILKELDSNVKDKQIEFDFLGDS